MPETLILFLALLAPIAAMLFLNLRLSRRLRYPHELLDEESRRGAAAFLFRALKTYYDLILDALLALVVALALTSGAGAKGASGGGKAGSGAVVIDCSRSMLTGRAGSRPIDLAMKRLAADPALSRARPFALVLDPRTARTRLLPISRLIKGVEGEAAAMRLEGELPFFAVDYRELVSLRRRGFGRITLLTDCLPFEPFGFEAIESGFAGESPGSNGFAVWPTAARYDRTAGSFIVTFAEAGPRASFTIDSMDGKTGRFESLEAGQAVVEERAGGRVVRLASPGIYLFAFKGPYGEADADFAIRLPNQVTASAASGSFSERMLAVFPLLEPSKRPAIVLSDSGTSPQGDLKRARVISTGMDPRDGTLLADPAWSACRPILSGDAGAGTGKPDFVLGPAALANADLPLAFDGAILSALPPSFVVTPPGGTKRLEKAGQAFLARVDGQVIAMNPPADEFFKPARTGMLALPPAAPPRAIWAAILALVAAAKLLAWKKSTGKKLLRRED